MASAELGCLKKVPTIESFDDDAEPTSRDSCVFIFCGGWGGAVGGGGGSWGNGGDGGVGAGRGGAGQGRGGGQRGV